jgi:hypothetical protein
MSQRLFRQKALEKLASPEQLDQLMSITTPRRWLMLIGGLSVAHRHHVECVDPAHNSRRQGVATNADIRAAWKWCCTFSGWVPRRTRHEVGYRPVSAAKKTRHVERLRVVGGSPSRWE